MYKTAYSKMSHKTSLNVRKEWDSNESHPNN